MSFSAAVKRLGNTSSLGGEDDAQAGLLSLAQEMWYGNDAPGTRFVAPSVTSAASSIAGGDTLSMSAQSQDAFFVPGASQADAVGSVVSGPASTSLYYAPVLAAGAANDVSVAQQSYVAKAGGLYNLGQMFTVSPVNGVMPASIRVSLYDRDNYAGNQTYAYGTLYGTDGEKDSASSVTLNFTLKNGKYVTSSGMSLADYTFQASSQQNRLQNITLSAFAANGAAVGTRNIDITTNSSYVDATPGLATAAEIAATARSFIGQTWNNNGCWVLASDIAACSGVSLTENSGFIAPTMQEANGQITVAYDAAYGVKSNWASTLQLGDMVEVGWQAKYGGGGHIFTIDRIAGGITYLVDNSGAINDGISTDVKVAEQNLASYLPYVDQSTVVVFRDTGASASVTAPTATVLVNPFTDVVTGGTIAASSLFSATDGAGKAISQYMVRDDGTNGHFNLAGQAQADGQWITVGATQLAQLTYTASATSATSDTIEVRAYDGSWGVADIGRVVSLSSLGGQTSGSVGTVISGQAKTVTDWLSSTAETWSFSVGSASGAVGISLANIAGSVNLSVRNSAGLLLASYNQTAFSSPLTLYGTLSAGAYSVKVTDLSGATNYDLTIGSQSTVLAQASTQTSGYSPPAASTGAAAPSVTGIATGDALFSGVAPSLALADSSGLGTIAYGGAVAAPSAGQTDRLQLLAQA